VTRSRKSASLIRKMKPRRKSRGSTHGEGSVPASAATQLSDSQAEVLTYVHEYVREHGYAPTVREVAAFMGWASTNSAHECLAVLASRGFVERSRGRARALRLIVSPAA